MSDLVYFILYASLFEFVFRIKEWSYPTFIIVNLAMDVKKRLFLVITAAEECSKLDRDRKINKNRIIFTLLLQYES